MKNRLPILLLILAAVLAGAPVHAQNVSQTAPTTFTGTFAGGPSAYTMLAPVPSGFSGSCV